MNTDERLDGAGHTARALNDISYSIIGAAYRVNSVLGVGFLEKVYENAMCWEIRKAALSVGQQVAIPVHYDGRIVGDYITDLIVENAILVEIKAVQALDRAHRAQCINYLRATRLRLCLLLNFGRPSLQVARIAL
jgi:GxxExxY protein